MSEPSQPTPPPVPARCPPVPQYGEYAPAGYVPPRPQPGCSPPRRPTGLRAAAYPTQPGPGGRRRKTWDLVLTIILLVLGFFGMLLGVVYGVRLLRPRRCSTRLSSSRATRRVQRRPSAPRRPVHHRQPRRAVPDRASAASIPLLLSKRVAFWVPLAAGVIAAIIFWAALAAMLLSDPALHRRSTADAEVTARSKQPDQQRLLGVQAVLRLVPDDALRSVDDVGGDLVAAVGREAVQEDRVGLRERHQLACVTW